MTPKAIVGLISASLTEAVVGNLPDELEKDIEIQGEVKEDNLFTWRVFLIFQDAVRRWLEDDQKYPPPKLSVNSSDVRDAIGALTPLLTGPLAPILQQLIAQIPGASVPDPGQPGSDPLPNP